MLTSGMRFSMPVPLPLDVSMMSFVQKLSNFLSPLVSTIFVFPAQSSPYSPTQLMPILQSIRCCPLAASALLQAVRSIR